MKPIYSTLTKTSIVIILLVNFFNLKAQTTYTWNVASGDFLTPTSWTPNRSAPAVTDILVFNGSVQANPIVNNIRSQNIGRLRAINNVNVTFTNAIPDTGVGTISRSSGQTVTGVGTSFLSQLRVNDQLYSTISNYLGEIATISSDLGLTTISAGTVSSTNFLILPRLTIKSPSTSVPALEVGAGSTIKLNCTAPGISIIADTGTYADIFGTITFSDRCRIYGTDANAIKVKSTGSMLLNNSFQGNVFGAAGAPNIVLFDSGAVFNQYGGTNPFGLPQPASRVTFSLGSNFIYYGTVTPAANGRNYPNFIYRSLSTLNLTGAAATSFQNIQIDSGQLNINMTGTVNIKGNIVVNNPGICTINPSTGSPNFIFNGTRLQTIGGAGTLNINTTGIARFTLNNSFGLRLDRAFTTGNGRMILDNGPLNLNGFNLTIGNNATAYGNIFATNGYITGNGNLIRWYPSGLVVTANVDSCLFPFGTPSAKRFAYVTGNPTVGGTISMSHNDAAGFTVINPPFNDNATNSVSVNVRQNYNWTIDTANGLAGTDFAITLKGNADPGQVTIPANMRVTLANTIAPGTTLDGSGTVLLPEGNRNLLTAGQLENTFYLGANDAQNALPVKFIAFNGKPYNKAVMLDWTTATETNNSHFLVERSTDGNRFAAIGQVKGNGNKNSISSYTFLDNTDIETNKIPFVYYRLKQVDFNGQTNDSKIIQVNLETKKTMELSPNPITDNINIVSNIPFIEYIEIVDLNGAVRIHQNMKENEMTDIQLNTTNLSKGIYLVRIVSRKETYTKKIIKE